MFPMEAFLFALVPLAMLATLAVLGMGVLQMIRGGNPQRSNRLMQSRVMLQAIAVLLFVLVMMMFKHH